MRRRRSEDELIDTITEAWDSLRGDLRIRLMLEHPDLYWALAWLTAGRTAKRSMSRR